MVFSVSKHDDHDYDATQVPVMVDQGDRHLILQANRNGFFYLIDRSNGKLVFANPFARVTWSDSKDASGVPLRERTPRRRWKGIACVRARPGDELDVANLRSANAIVLRYGAGAV